MDWYHIHLGRDLPSSMSSLTELPRACLLGDTRSCHVDDQYSPSQMVGMRWVSSRDPQRWLQYRAAADWTPWHFLSSTVFLSCPFSLCVASRLGSRSLPRSSSMSAPNVDSLLLSVGETLRRQTFGLLLVGNSLFCD